MRSSRPFTEWLQRWRVLHGERQPQLADQVQPVVLVDDTSSLQVPPVRQVYGARFVDGGAALNHSGLAISARSKPLLILDILSSDQLVYGLAATDPLTASLATRTPTSLEGDLTIGATAFAQDGQTVGFPAELDSAESPRNDPGIMNPVDLLVMPGQVFLAFHPTIATGFVADGVRWIELDVATLETSQRRD